jgi:DNA polymerase-3 subunit gamma/tau
MVKIGGEDSELLQVSADERARAARSAVLFSEEDLTRFLQVMLRTFDELNYRQEQRFHLELGLVKLVHLQRLLPVEELLSQLPSSGGGSLPRPSTTSSASPTSAARPAVAVRAPEPAKPAASPFEADRSRKISSESTVSTKVETAPVIEMATEPAAAPRTLTPLEVTARAVETAPAKAPVSVTVDLPVEATNGALALDTEPVAEAKADAGDAPLIDLERIREAVVVALENGGHNTAAVLLNAGKWSLDGGTIRVEVGIKKTMLGLTMNMEAEKIVRNALRAIGASQKLVVVPGENGAVSSEPGPRVVSGSMQAAALENPLVKQAMDLFGGEVRSVLDLRDKK